MQILFEWAVLICLYSIRIRFLHIYTYIPASLSQNTAVSFYQLERTTYTPQNNWQKFSLCYAEIPWNDFHVYFIIYSLLVYNLIYLFLSITQLSLESRHYKLFIFYRLFLSLNLCSLLTHRVCTVPAYQLWAHSVLNSSTNESVVEVVGA